MSLFTQHGDVLFGPTSTHFIRSEGTVIADTDGTRREIYLSVVIGYNLIDGSAWVMIDGRRVCLGSSIESLSQWLGLSKSVLWDYLEQSIEAGNKPYWRVYFTRERQRDPINLKQDLS